MELPFRSDRAGLLSIKSLVLLFSILLGSSVVLAGGMPAEVEEEASMMEKSAEVEVPAPEVKKDLPTAGSGFTVGARGALGILSSDSVSGASTSQHEPLVATVDHDEGYSFSFMLGYALGNGLRLEAEGGYMNNGLFVLSQTIL